MIEIKAPHVPVRQMAAQSRSIGEMFCRQVVRIRDRNAYFVKKDGVWVGTTWGQWYDTSMRVAGGLHRLGIKPGERIAILGPTQPQWVHCDIGAHLAGVVSVGIYPMQTPEQLRYILEHSEARVVFVDGDEEIRNVIKGAEGLDSVLAIVPWTEQAYAAFKDLDKRVKPMRDFQGDPITDVERDRRIAEQEWDKTAMFIYTSGTTGPPKAAMISHANLMHLLRAMNEQQELFEDDLSLVFLPLAHAAERNLSYYGRISSGLTACYASSTAAVLEELKEVRPTIFGSVPRIFEKAYGRIQAEVEKASPGKQKIFRWAEKVGRDYIRLKLADKPIPLGLALQYKIAYNVVFKKVREAFGGRVKQFVTGAAPIAIEILEFFWAAGLPIYEAYGMTEATVCTHITRPGHVKLGTVGKPVEPIEHKIAEDGEILVRGAWVFQGYFKNEDATRETIVEGWLHTGDIGHIDPHGFLRITDRKKHLIITAGGKNLSPANIENAIKNESPLISQVHAHGDRRPYVSCIIAPSPVETLEWGVAHGTTQPAEAQKFVQELMANPAARSAALNAAMAKVIAHPEFAEQIKAAVQRGNDKLANVEKVKRFMILDRDFSQEAGELTPTMKVKRK